MSAALALFDDVCQSAPFLYWFRSAIKLVLEYNGGSILFRFRRSTEWVRVASANSVAFV